MNIKQLSKIILILGLMLSGCAPNRTNQHLYIGIATHQEHLKSSQQIIKNSLLPIGLNRKLPDYVHIDSLSSKRDYDKIFQGKPKPKNLFRYQEKVDALEPVELTHHNRLLVGLKRLLFLIKQDNQPSLEMRGIIIISGFNPSELLPQEEEQLRHMVKELIAHKDSLEILCLVGTVTGPPENKLSSYFSDEAIRGKVVVTDPNKDDEFERQCLR